MNAERPTVIAVRPAAALAARPRLFAALEAAFPVVFRAWDGDAAGVAGVIAIGEDVVPHEVPVLAVGDSTPGGRPVEVALGGSGVDPRLRGLAVSDRLGELAVVPGAEVLATAQGAPAWTRSRGGVQRVASALPELAPDEVLYALVTSRALTLVALVQFLRELTAGAGWQAPPPRAAIVFDDPNLRWRSYGFIDYGGWSSTPTSTPTTRRWR